MVRKGCLVMAMGLSLSLALSGTGPVLADDEGSSSGSSSGGSDSSSSSSGGDSPPPYNTLLDVGGAKDTGGGGGGGKEGGNSTPAAAPAAPATEGGDSGAPKADPVKDPAPNALGGLFVPQPQYPSPNKTIMNPDTVPSHLGSDGSQPGRNPGQPGAVYDPSHSSAVQGTENKDNPLKGLFQMQPQYPSPGKTIMFPEAVPKNLGDDGSVQGRNPGQAGAVYQGEDPNKFAEPSGNKDNVLKGLFQMQPQYPSPGKTVMFPEPVPAHLGGTSNQAGSQPGQAPGVYTPPRFEEVEQKMMEAAAAASGNPLEKVETEKGKEEVKDKDVKEGKDKDKEGKDKDKEGKDKEGKDKDKDKDKEGKDKEKGKEDDKDKEGKDKEKDEAEKDKDKEKSAEEKDKDGAAEKSEDKDKSKEEGRDKEGKDKEGKDKEGKDGKSKDAKDKEKGKEKKDETKYEAYHPLREAILLMNTGKLQQSQDLLHKHLSQNPRDAQAFYTRAVLRVNMRNYAGAAEDYREVIKLVPTGDLSNLARTGLAKIHF